MSQPESLSCPVCLSQYDIGDHIPVIIPTCGHSICQSCLDDLKTRANLRCPLDNKIIGEGFSVNFLAKSLFEEAFKKGFCIIHFEKFSIICLNDKSKLCEECRSISNHKDHDFKPINEIEVETIERIGGLNMSLSSIEDYYKEMQKKLEEVRLDLASKIMGECDELVSLIHLRRKDLLFQVNTKVNAEKRRLENLYGRDSVVRGKIQDEIKKYNELLSQKDFYRIWEENSKNNNIPKLNETWLRDKRIEYKSKKEGLLCDIGNKIKSVGVSMMDIDLLQKSIIEGVIIGNVQQGSDEIDLKQYELKSYTKVDINEEEKSLDIFVQNTFSNTLLNLDLDCWKDLDKINFSISKFKIDEEELQMIAHIVTKVKQVSSISITATGLQDIQEQDLSCVFQVLFARSKELKKVEIDFSSSWLDDQGLIFIAEKIISKLQSLESFCCYLSRTKISDKGLDIFAQTLKHRLKYLQCFKLDLGFTDVSKASIKKLFLNMGNLKVFMLDLSNINIDDQALKIFVDQTLNSMNLLEEFTLFLRGTKVTAGGFVHLLAHLTRFKDITLSTSCEVDVNQLKTAVNTNNILGSGNLINLEIDLFRNGNLSKILNKSDLI